MRRRDFIKVIGGLGASWPLTARAQQPPRLLRIGMVSLLNPRTAPHWVAVEQRLRELGYVEGQSYAFDFILLNGQIERFDEATNELIRRKADIIVAFGTEFALKSAVAATDKVPIVMAAVDFDPIAHGYVGSLARPGGNVTGVVFQQIELASKRVQLTQEAFQSESYRVLRPRVGRSMGCNEQGGVATRFAGRRSRAERCALRLSAGAYEGTGGPSRRPHGDDLCGFLQ